MRHFGPIVQALVLAMFYAGHDLYFGGSVDLELIGDQHPRRIAQSRKQLAEKPLCRLPVPSALHQNVERVAVLIHGAPQVMMLAISSSMSRKLRLKRKYSHTTWLMMSDGQRNPR